LISLEQIDHVAITVSDLDCSIEWYRDVLGLERIHEEAWGDTPVIMSKGGTAIALFRAKDSEQLKNTQIKGMLHLAFRTGKQDFSNAQVFLRSKGIEFEFQDHSISHSVYFNDPDGYEIEITTYEL
jgi:catechol 2,3-dioxygenase-like lactoylglutathione lyase family enzyme